jgi:Na+/H+-dicarboxylate symporter
VSAFAGLVTTPRAASDTLATFMRQRGLLTILTLLGLIAGGAAGHVLLWDSAAPVPESHWTRTTGEVILVRPLLLLTIPIVFLGLTVAAASIGGAVRVAFAGGAAAVLFLVSMLLAATLGAAASVLLKPGDVGVEARAALTGSAEPSYAAGSDVVAVIERTMRPEDRAPARLWRRIIHQLVPEGALSEALAGRILSVVLLAMLLGLGIAAGGERTAAAHRFFEAALAALLVIAGWLAWLLPITAFLLAAWMTGRIGLETITGPLWRFMAIVAGALAAHAMIILPILLAILGRANPYRFLWRCRVALLTAFSTASSAAALPVVLAAASSDGACSKRAAGLVLPLGAAVNMNGTALFQAAAVVFLCQVYGIDLSFPEMLVAVLTATLAAIGTGGTPSAGLVTLVAVIAAVNTGLAARGASELPFTAIGILIAIDRLLDMLRTAVNVWGDLVIARIVSVIAPDEPERGITAESPRR